MDQRKAQALFREGAILLLHNVPEGTEFGIDWNSWTTGPKFKGVKMIPPGVHFVFYSAVSKSDGTPSPRTGFFHTFKTQEIFIRSWNDFNEELLDENNGLIEIENVKKDLKNLDQYLGAYPYNTLKKWVSMSNNITPELVQRLSPTNGVIYSVLELLPSKNKNTADQSSSSQFESLVDADGLPALKVNPDSILKFTVIPERWYPAGSTPQEISKHSMDSSFILNQIFKNYTKPVDILGELQFAFICFILGQVFDAFETWKKLVHVLCSCETALQDNVDLYIALIGVLYHQINEIPQDFFVDIISSNNFLVSTLTVLFSSIEQSCFNEQLQIRAKQFRKFLTKKFKWKFNTIPDDWAPVVVDL